MTIPIHPVVVQQEGFGEALQKSAAPLLAALADRKRLNLASRELQLKEQELQQMAAVRGAQAAESRVNAQRMLAELKKERETLEAQQRASSKFMGAFNVDESGRTVFDEGRFIEIVSQTSDPTENAHLLGMASSLGQTTQKILEIGEQRDAAEMRRQVMPIARRLLQSPNARVPTDPTIAEASALEMMGILDFAEQRLRNQQQNASEAQADRIFLRQQVVNAYKASVDSWQTELREIAGQYNPGSERYQEAIRQLSGPTSRERLEQFLPAGMSFETARDITKSNVFNFQTQNPEAARTVTTPQPQAPVPTEEGAPTPAFPAVRNSAAFKRLNTEDQQLVVEAAQQLFNEGIRDTNIPEDRWSEGTPANIRALIRAQLRRLHNAR